MDRLTTKNTIGENVLISGCYCDECGELTYRPTTYGEVNPIDRLAEYEDLEEQGLLLILPCKIGDTVYVIPSSVNYKLNVLSGHEDDNKIYKQKVNRIEIYEFSYILSTCNGWCNVLDKMYKETWFLTKEEAEAKLKELKQTK